MPSPNSAASLPVELEAAYDAGAIVFIIFWSSDVKCQVQSGKDVALCFIRYLDR